MFVEINMYNANINRWTSVRLLFEMPLTGGVRANAYYGVVKMFRYFLIDNWRDTKCAMADMQTIWTTIFCPLSAVSWL